MNKTIILFLCLIFVKNCWAEDIIFDGYFYDNEVKKDCHVIAELKPIPISEAIWKDFPYKVLDTRYTGKFKNGIMLSVEYSMYNDGHYPLLNKIIEIEKFHSTKRKGRI